MTTISYQINQS